MDGWAIAGILGCFLITVLAKGGIVLTKKGIAQNALPPLTLLKWSVVKQYVTCRTWLLGIFLDMCAGGVGIVALREAPVSVCSPIGFSGVAICAILSHVVLKEVLSLGQWIAISLMLVGAGLLGATLNDDKLKVDDPNVYSVVACFAGGLAFGGVCELFLRHQLASGDPPNGVLPPAQLSHRRMQIVELVAGLQIGVTMGLGIACVSGILKLGDAMGTVFVVFGVQIAGWLCLLSLLAGQRAFVFGKANSINAYTMVTQLVVTVAVGRLVLNEEWPDETWKTALRWTSFAIFVIATAGFNLTAVPTPVKLSGTHEDTSSQRVNLLEEIDPSDPLPDL